MAAISDPQSDQQKLDDAMKAGLAASYYNFGKVDREPYLERARDLSSVTIPYLFRQEGENGSMKLVIPWNSIGAYCVSNLGAKIVFALFPPGRPNFKATQSKSTALDLLALPPEEQARIKGIISQGLSQMEQDTVDAIEEDGDRARMFIAALHLIVSGNHAFQFYDDSTIRGIPLNRYVVTRDAQGNLLRWAIEDQLDWETIPKDVREAVKAATGMERPPLNKSGRSPIKVYSHGMLINGKWKCHQEVMGQVVQGSEVTYAKDKLPYLFLAWQRLDEEDYGRSYSELYEGDLLTAESFTKSIGEGAAAMARFLILVSPTGMTDKRTLAKARNGDVITGREQDVHIPTGQGKSVDFQVAASEEEKALGRLAKAYLLNSSVQRQGERVTAEEIRAATQELEDALGGVYSQQVISWQLPYIQTKVRLLQRTKRVTPIPENAVKIQVTAGLAALARNAELAGLRTYAGILTETFGPSELPNYLNPAEFSNRVAAALGVDPVGLIPTRDEVAERQAKEQQMALMAQMGPEVIKQAGNNLTSNQVAATNADAKLATQAAPAQPAPAAQ